MWPYSSNMFLIKKLITNLCLFPNNKNKCPCRRRRRPVSPSFTTHLSRHFSTHHNNNQKIITMIDDTSTSKSTINGHDFDNELDDHDHDQDRFFTSSSIHSQHLINNVHHFQHQQPDFATAFASNRFFFSSPGNSKSLISTPPQQQLQNISKTNNNDDCSHDLLFMTGGVPVFKHSPDPYSDFKKSMQEMMMEARSNGVENWDYLHRLLTCYLTLNPRNTHECIINAFSDLLVSSFISEKQSYMDRKPTTGSAPSVSRRLL